MTAQDIDILTKYLVKAIVPQAEIDQFIAAVQRLQALRQKEKQAA
jgi:hypothetical protein